MSAPSRRGFLALLGAGLVAAPAIVRASSIMPIKAHEPIFAGYVGEYHGVLIRYRREIIREYVRQNLFAPYVGSEATSIVRMIGR